MPPLDLHPEISGAIAWLMGFGFIGLFVLAILEKFVPLFPSYILLMLLGLTVPDLTTLVPTVAAITTGSVIGGLGWYAAGWSLGPDKVRSAVIRYGPYVLLRPTFYDRLAAAYHRNHFWTTLSGQIVPGVRIYLALPAGVLRLAPVTFVTATSLGSLMWNAPFLCLGFALRGTGQEVATIGFWGAVVLVTVEGGILFALRRRSKRSRRRPVPHPNPAAASPAADTTDGHSEHTPDPLPLL